MDRWQITFSSLAGFFLLYHIFAGWRLGIVRQAVQIISLAVAYYIGEFFGVFTLPFLLPLHYPNFVLEPIGSALLGFAAFMVINFLSWIVFRKTSKQKGALWVIYGTGGAALGTVYGMVFIVFAAVGIRVAGAFLDNPSIIPPGSLPDEEKTELAQRRSIAGNDEAPDEAIAPDALATRNKGSRAHGKPLPFADEPEGAAYDSSERPVRTSKSAARKAKSVLDAARSLMDGAKFDHQKIQPAHAAAVPVFVSGLVRLKRNLNSGKIGASLDAVDPVSKKTYDLLAQTGQMAGNPEAMNRFMSFPGAKEFEERPEMVQLRNDPEVRQAIAERRFFALFSNAHVIRVLNNEEFQNYAKGFEFAKALEYANGKGSANEAP